MDSTDISWTSHPKIAEYTFFLSIHGIFSRTDHMLGHKVSLVMHRARISKPTERQQVHHSNAKARREFISSVLGPKSHPAQRNPTRAPNKGVWRLIYRQFFVSVIGVAGVTWLARQDERTSYLFLVNVTQVLEPVVWSLTSLSKFKKTEIILNIFPTTTL